VARANIIDKVEELQVTADAAMVTAAGLLELLFIGASSSWVSKRAP